MPEKQLVVLQIISIASIDPSELDSYNLGQIDTDYREQYKDLWTPKQHVQYETVNMEGATIECLDIKTMISWQQGGEIIFDAEQKTAIKIRGDWYIVIDESRDYDWVSLY